MMRLQAVVIHPEVFEVAKVRKEVPHRQRAICVRGCPALILVGARLTQSTTLATAGRFQPQGNKTEHEKEKDAPGLVY